ncbi:MAG TPA: 16S rRNA (cytidine(1402)-2'-O)-methyltransferase [Thermotogota bacterium]|nr:16S rRNA (cytidine(1402)-2'-O)-methyltransferase [Thermotogota bacterium]HRW35854.1 16S rRNA (cytidine(1402)-2'-O)-methyltransferase [Thermotogota bacterium]
MSGQLTIVGTPIGNFGDCSPRALESLKNADTILAEDTRRTMVLLNHFQLGKKELISFSQQKERLKSEMIIEKLKTGQQIALVSDAGMPCVSDPGSFLVEACYDHGIDVEVIPGPSAFVLAYAASGFGGSFIFEGFLGRDKKLRRYLRTLIGEKRHVIFYESPFRLNKCLSDILNILGDREVFVAREMTKMHQEFFRGKCSQALIKFSDEIKGELTVIIRGDVQ